MSDAAYSVLKVLIARSDDIAGAVERMPEAAKVLYEDTVQDLHVELALLSTAGTDNQRRLHEDNIRHLKSALSSLDAVSDIKVYRTTVRVLGEIIKTAIAVALAL